MLWSGAAITDGLDFPGRKSLGVSYAQKGLSKRSGWLRLRESVVLPGKSLKGRLQEIRAATGSHPPSTVWLEHRRPRWARALGFY